MIMFSAGSSSPLLRASLSESIMNAHKILCMVQQDGMYGLKALPGNFVCHQELIMGIWVGN
jgi:hypothetical protein